MFLWACSSGGGPVPAGFAGPIPLGLFLCPPLRGGPVAVGLPPGAPWRRLGGFWSRVPGTLFLTLPSTGLSRRLLGKPEGPLGGLWGLWGCLWGSLGTLGLPARASWRRLGSLWSRVLGTLFLTLPGTNPSGGGGREAGGHEGGWAHHNVEERWSRGRVRAPWDGAFTCKEGLTRRWPVGLAYCYCQRSAIAHQARVPLGCSSSMHAGHQ